MKSVSGQEIIKNKIKSFSLKEKLLILNYEL